MLVALVRGDGDDGGAKGRCVMRWTRRGQKQSLAGGLSLVLGTVRHNFTGYVWGVR